MDFLQPAGPVVGPFPLHAVVSTVCGLHLLVNMVVLGSVSSEKSIKVSQVEISPQVQCAVGAFALIGIPVIIHGGMGAIYRAPGHLSAYNYYLGVCLAFAALWFGIFAKFQNPCATVNRPGRLATMVCDKDDDSILIMLILVMILTSAAIYLVWSMQENIKERLETDLFRYKEPYALYEQMADDAAAQMAYDAQKLQENSWKVNTPMVTTTYHQAPPAAVQTAAPVVMRPSAPVVLQSAPVVGPAVYLPPVVGPVMRSAPAVGPIVHSAPAVGPVVHSAPPGVVREPSMVVVLS